jgi:hypothetical protein
MKIRTIILILSIVSSSLNAMEYSPPQTQQEEVKDIDRFVLLSDELLLNILHHAMPNTIKVQTKYVCFGNVIDEYALKQDFKTFDVISQVCKRFNLIAQDNAIKKKLKDLQQQYTNTLYPKIDKLPYINGCYIHNAF